MRLVCCHMQGHFLRRSKEREGVVVAEMGSPVHLMHASAILLVPRFGAS